MSPLKKTQIKEAEPRQMRTGKPITVMQFIMWIAPITIGLATGAIVNYTKAQVDKSVTDGRLKIVEAYQAKQDQNADSRKAARDLQIKSLEMQLLEQKAKDELQAQQMEFLKHELEDIRELLKTKNK